jgi:hypothetical protein
MAITDTLSGYIKITFNLKLKRTESDTQSGGDFLNPNVRKDFSDGSGNNQADRWLNGEITVPSAGAVTVSLADTADPFGTMGDSVPTSDPEGKKIKAILIENEDENNYITLGLGTNNVTNWLGGSSPTIRIPAGGVYLQVFPNGIDAINDGTDDEITLVADTADCTVQMSVLYG